jgi:hypothetical protein
MKRHEKMQVMSLGDGIEHMKIAGENIGKIAKFEAELLNTALLGPWI